MLKLFINKRTNNTPGLLIARPAEVLNFSGTLKPHHEQPRNQSHIIYTRAAGEEPTCYCPVQLVCCRTTAFTVSSSLTNYPSSSACLVVTHPVLKLELFWTETEGLSYKCGPDPLPQLGPPSACFKHEPMLSLCISKSQVKNSPYERQLIFLKQKPLFLVRGRANRNALAVSSHTA